MFPSRYFPSRYFAPRFFPKVGASPPPPPPSAGLRFLVNNGEINMTGQGEGTVGYEVLLAQTANITSTLVFTADRTGLYRVSMSAATSSAGVTGTLSAEIEWAGHPKSFFSGMDLTDADASDGYSQLFYLTASDTVTYAATITAGAGSPEYNLLVTVERIWVAT